MAVLLPKAGADGASQVAERLRSAIEAKKIAGIRVTASFGVAPLDEMVTDPSSLVERADEALYRSKEKGRNRVTVAEPRNDAPGNPRRWTRSA
jgi:diguanylate cyclase (GGDEF)-like protein